jgi:hypothetical protein
MQGPSTEDTVAADETATFASKLAQLIGVANLTSAAGWQSSQDDSVGARDRDGTWVTRNGKQMEVVFNAINSTIPRASKFEWLLQTPTPLYMMLEQTLGVEIKLLIIPPGQILPPVEHPTGTVVLSKALSGACDVRQYLGDPRGIYIHIHAYIHKNTHACMHTYIHTYIHAYVCMYTHTHIHAHMLHVCACVYVCACVCVCVFV